MQGGGKSPPEIGEDYNIRHGEVMIMTEEALVAALKGLEMQLAVLRAAVKRRGMPSSRYSFGDLYGILAGKVSTSEEEIEAAKYHFEWEGKEKR
jgi:hypothetical protein